MSKVREVRAAIIGCGGIAFEKHMPSLAKLDYVKMGILRYRRGES